MKTADLGVLSNQAAVTPGSARESNTRDIPSSRAFQPSATVELPDSNRLGKSSGRTPEPDGTELRH